jgi:Na+-driven multidrug efflux pump
VTSVTRNIVFFVPLIIMLPLFLGIEGIMFAGPIADSAAACIAIFFVVRELRKLRECGE